jgi:selenocysteine lyase/cysteine desulfurase
MPNFPSLFVLREGLRFLLQAGVGPIFGSLRPLVDRLRQGFERLGCQMLTPPGPQYASGIVAFSHPQAEQIGASLAREGVIVWGGMGRVRASVHLYNDAEDVERCLSALAGVLPQSYARA